MTIKVNAAKRIKASTEVNASWYGNIKLILAESCIKLRAIRSQDAGEDRYVVFEAIQFDVSPHVLNTLYKAMSILNMGWLTAARGSKIYLVFASDVEGKTLEDYLHRE